MSLKSERINNIDYILPGLVPLPDVLGGTIYLEVFNPKWFKTVEIE